MCQDAPEQIAGSFVLRTCYIGDEPFYQLANGSLIAASADIHPQIDGIAGGCYIGPKAKIGKYVELGSFCHIAGGVTIVGNTTLAPHVVAFEQSMIGERCSIGRGCVITAWSHVGRGSLLGDGTIVVTGPDRVLPDNFEYGTNQHREFGPCLTVEIFDSMLISAP